MVRELCFVTYIDVIDLVKEAARDNDFIVCGVKQIDDNFKACHVWMVDEGASATALTRAVYLGMRVKNIEYCRNLKGTCK